MKSSTTFSGFLEAFFTDRLMRQRQVSPHTIVSYRETFRQLLRFAQDRLKKPPYQMSLEDLDAPLIGTFLDHAEKVRGLSARSRNVRLAAIRSFFRYVALQEPLRSGLIQRVLAMPNKKFVRQQVNYLTRPEVEALLASPDRHTWSGRRDHALLLVAVQTGLRCSELAGLRIENVELGRGPHLRCYGKECHSYCISFRRRNETTIIHACRQVCDLASSLADVLQVVRTGFGLDPYTDARGAGRVGPMSEPYPA